MKALTKKNIKNDRYSEESPKLAIGLAVSVVILVAAPLTMANMKIIDEGSRAADVSMFVSLTQRVGNNVSIVQKVLDKGVVKEIDLSDGVPLVSKGTTLITPPVSPTNVNEKGDAKEIALKLSGIYWSQHDPIATIDNDNYHVGEKVNGFLILEIRKTEVVFRSPSGEKVIKYFYDYLN